MERKKVPEDPQGWTQITTPLPTQAGPSAGWSREGRPLATLGGAAGSLLPRAGVRAKWARPPGRDPVSAAAVSAAGAELAAGGAAY